MFKKNLTLLENVLFQQEAGALERFDADNYNRLKCQCACGFGKRGTKKRGVKNLGAFTRRFSVVLRYIDPVERYGVQTMVGYE
jgi:hypothetical protein